MEIAAFKVKSRILPMLTFGHSDLNILSYRIPFDANLKILCKTISPFLGK
jgi:hypothetical protein